MPAKQLQCAFCGRKFWASRSDSKWHSQRCKYLSRAEDAKFELPSIPKSGVPGVTFSRYRKRWEVRVKPPEHQAMKYVGSFENLQEALRFRLAILRK